MIILLIIGLIKGYLCIKMRYFLGWYTNKKKKVEVELDLSGCFWEKDTKY